MTILKIICYGKLLTVTATDGLVYIRFHFKININFIRATVN